MSTNTGIATVTARAGSAVSRYRFVKRAADGKYDHVSTAHIVVDGIAADDAAADLDDFPMQIPNGALSQAMAGAAITEGVLVATDNAGKLIAYVDSATNIAIGRLANGGDAASGDIVTFQFMIIGSNAGA